jgi:hypothetical protein
VSGHGRVLASPHASVRFRVTGIERWWAALEAWTNARLDEIEMDLVLKAIQEQTKRGNAMPPDHPYFQGIRLGPPLHERRVIAAARAKDFKLLRKLATTPSLAFIALDELANSGHRSCSRRVAVGGVDISS